MRKLSIPKSPSSANVKEGRIVPLKQKNEQQEISFIENLDYFNLDFRHLVVGSYRGKDKLAFPYGEYYRKPGVMVVKESITNKIVTITYSTYDIYQQIYLSKLRNIDKYKNWQYAVIRLPKANYIADVIDKIKTTYHLQALNPNSCNLIKQAENNNITLGLNDLEFLPIYKEGKIRTFSRMQGRPAIYFIKENDRQGNNTLVYIGKSLKNLTKRLYLHFEKISACLGVYKSFYYDKLETHDYTVSVVEIPCVYRDGKTLIKRTIDEVAPILTQIEKKLIEKFPTRDNDKDNPLTEEERERLEKNRLEMLQLLGDDEECPF